MNKNHSFLSFDHQRWQLALGLQTLELERQDQKMKHLEEVRFHMNQYKVKLSVSKEHRENKERNMMT